MKGRFWFSKNQYEVGKDLEYYDYNGRPSKHADAYALIDGKLYLYSEMNSSGDPNYRPNWDDAIYLGEGEFACTENNIQTYLEKHPEVRVEDEHLYLTIAILEIIILF